MQVLRAFCPFSHMSHVRTNVHQVGYAGAALAFGIALKQLAYLEE